MLRKLSFVILFSIVAIGLATQAFALPSAYFAKGQRTVSVNTSGVISVPVKLTRTAAGAVTVNFTVSSPYETPAHGTAFVSGKNYTLSAGSVTFAAGETSKSATLTIVERKTADDNLHIPFYKEKLRLTLAVDPADTAKARTGSVGNTIDVEVTDAVVKGVRNVRSYGATGDGSTNDQTAIQNAITAAAALISNPATDQAVVYFPAGTYRMGTNITVPAGITLLGDGYDKTRIKRFGRNWFVSQRFPTESKAVFVVSGITTAPTAEAVYYDANGNYYKYYSATLTGAPKAGTIYFSRIANSVAPPASGTLTKESGTGDTTITFSQVARTFVTLQVSGVTEKPAVGSVYTNDGGTYKYFYDHISSGSGPLIMEKTQGVKFANAAQPLVKQSGAGDDSITISSLGDNTPAAYKFNVSGVTTPPAQGDFYVDNATGVTYLVYSHTIVSGSGTIYCSTASGVRGYPNNATGTLTRSTGSGDATISFSSWDCEGRWWCRMLFAGSGYTSASPSSLSGIRNLTIDGNWTEFPEFQTWSYTLYEPSGQLDLTVGNGAGQYRFLLENVLFTDGITTHLATVSNSKTYIYNTRLQDSTAFKGKFSLVGGHNDMFIRQSEVIDNFSNLFTNLDIEQNSATQGYYADSRYTVTVTNSIINGILQFTGWGSGTKTFTVTDSVMGNIDGYATAVFTANNVTFNFDAYGSNRTYFYGVKGGMNFTNCTFNIYPATENNRYPGIVWNFANAVGETYTFTNCTFNKAGTHTYGDGSTYAFYNVGNSLTKTSGYLVFNGCTFYNFTYALYLGNGGNVSFKNTVVQGCDTFCHLYGYDSTYNFKATFENIQFDGNYYLSINGSSSSTLNEIVHVTSEGEATTVLAREHAKIKGGTASHNGQYLLDGVFTGKRQIVGDSEPTTQDTGLLGDEFKYGVNYWDVNPANKDNAGYYIWRSSSYDNTIWAPR